MSPSRPKRALALLTLSFAATLVGLLLGEAALRLLGIAYPSFYMVDEHRGHALRPGAEGWFRTEGEAYVSVNRHGLRDVEQSLEKPPDTFRIAVLGDSFALAKQVALEETFWNVLETELSACPNLGGQQVEAINFGVSGYSTAQELLTLRHHAWDYEPDLVLLAFVTGNDVSDNSKRLRPQPIPYFELVNGELVLDNSFREHPEYQFRRSWIGRSVYALIGHSRILQLVNHVKNVRSSRGRKQHREAQNEVRTGVELGLFDEVHRPPRDPAWRSAWRVTEHLVTQIAREVQQRSVGFLTVTLSRGIQVDPDPKVREAFRQALGVRNLFYPEQRLQALGRREGFDVFNLAPRLRAYAEAQQLQLHGFANAQPGRGHWNVAGHQAAGRELGTYLCPRVSLR